MRVTKTSLENLMPRQNRVTPFGDIVVDPSRGSLMGNRGILHDSEQRLGKSRWRHKNWVACVLSFKGRKRPLMAPGHYTELFFLDEATALAAGHRPCAECRRQDFGNFVTAWTAGNKLDTRPAAPVLDSELHSCRVSRTGERITFTWPANRLPNGTMIALGGSAWLVWHGQRLKWSFLGYGERQPLEEGQVIVLTPLATVGALRGGYVPAVHFSADQ